MKKFTLASLSAILFVQVCLSQQPQGPNFRVGDAFRGHIKQVRSETARLRIVDGAVVEGPRMLAQIVDYADDGLTRETSFYSGPSVQRKNVETFLPNGSRQSMAVYQADGTLISKVGYEYDAGGQLASEVQYQPDGSVKDKRIIQMDQSSNQVAITRTSGTGVETSINTSERTQPLVPNSPAKRSVWSTTKADGSRTENIFEVDEAGNHNDQQLYYAADGTITGRRVSIVDASINRLEATEYNADGSIKDRRLNTREYDAQRNLIKSTDYFWNAKREKFEPVAASYNTIIYR